MILTPNQIDEAILKIDAELSLYQFLKQGWKYIEGDVPFMDNWHLEAICEHLEAVANRQIKNLLINMPPRCGKSTTISVAFPAWRWLKKPGERFLCSSYSLTLALRDSVKCRTLVTSPWYLKNWGDRYQLISGQKTKSKFANNMAGYRQAVSSGSTITGEGGNILIADDPNSGMDQFSEVQRQSKINWWTSIWSSRLNDKKNDCKVVVMQRLHEDDITGHIIRNDLLEEWTCLVLPMEFESRRKAKTIILPSSNGKIWSDPREDEGELLWESRIGRAELARIKQDFGSEYVCSGQLQQNPSPSEGGILKKHWFKWWKSPNFPRLDHIIQSWDTAISDSPDADYSACTTWGIFYDSNGIGNILLLSMWRGRVGFPDLRDRAHRLARNYLDTGDNRTHLVAPYAVDVILIETKATGDPLIKELRKLGIPAQGYDPTRKGNKEARVQMIAHLIENGLVWLPAQAPAYERLMPFADEFLEEMGRFPNGTSKDLADSMSQVLTKLRDSNFLKHGEDKKERQEYYTAPTKLY